MQDILEKYTALEKAWHSLIQDVELLHEISEPWKNLVDRFDDLDVWLDELERQMNQDERDIEEMDEAEGGDLSDKIVNFKVCMLCWSMLALFVCLFVFVFIYLFVLIGLFEENGPQ